MREPGMMHEEGLVTPGTIVHSESFDEHATPRATSVDRASLSTPHHKEESKNKRKRLMRQAISWQGLLENPFSQVLQGKEGMMMSLQEQLGELQSQNEMLRKENKAQGETIEHQQTLMTKVADLAAEKAASQFQNIMADENKRITELQYQNRAMKSLFGKD